MHGVRSTRRPEWRGNIPVDSDVDLKRLLSDGHIISKRGHPPLCFLGDGVEERMGREKNDDDALYTSVISNPMVFARSWNVNLCRSSAIQSAVSLTGRVKLPSSPAASAQTCAHRVVIPCRVSHQVTTSTSTDNSFFPKQVVVSLFTLSKSALSRVLAHTQGLGRTVLPNQSCSALCSGLSAIFSDKLTYQSRPILLWGLSVHMGT